MENNTNLGKTKGESTKHDIRESRQAYLQSFITVLTVGVG